MGTKFCRRIELGRRSRYYQLSLIISRELDKRKRKEEMWKYAMVRTYFEVSTSWHNASCRSSWNTSTIRGISCSATYRARRASWWRDCSFISHFTCFLSEEAEQSRAVPWLQLSYEGKNWLPALWPWSRRQNLQRLQQAPKRIKIKQPCLNTFHNYA